MSKMNPRTSMRLKRKSRIRKNLSGTSSKPRLSVFRSARHIYAQIIDDLQGVTLVAAGSLPMRASCCRRVMLPGLQK